MKPSISKFVNLQSKHGVVVESTAKRSRRRHHLAVFLFAVLALLPNTLLSQTGYVLWQDTEGSATVYIDEPKQIAYLIDGGRSGTLMLPRVENRTALEFLLEKQCEHLVIVCSHPHEDHSGGFKQIIDADLNLLKFKTICFIDSGYPEKESLYEQFLRQQPSYPRENVTHLSAETKNAFAGISGENDAVFVSNFEYVPKAGAKEHGNSIITRVVLQKDGKRTSIVDFDDGDSSLLARWVAWAKESPTDRRPDIVIAPHHCSDGTEIEPLLESSVRPKSCIVTADVGNRYQHPGPVMFNKWVNALGIASVHITGAEEESIKITESGLPEINNESVLRKIAEDVVKPQIVYFASQNGSEGKRAALEDTRMKYYQASSASASEGSIGSQGDDVVPKSGPPLQPVNAALENLERNIGSWVVTENSSGKLFVHQSESGGYLNNLLYTAQRVNGKWRVTSAGGEYLGEIDAPRVSIGSCTCY